jgi:class 3 adenylate cyclase
MAGYTALAEKLGEEQTCLLMQRVHHELNQAMHGHGGTVLEMTGDGVLLVIEKMVGARGFEPRTSAM